MLCPSNSKNSNTQEQPQDDLNSLLELYNHGKLQQVFEKAQTLKKRYAKSLQLWNLMGASAVQIGKLDEAVLAFQKTLSIKPDYADAYYNMGVTLQDLGKLEEAIEAYTKALSIKPDYAAAYSNMGVTLQDLGELDQAIEAYSKALAIKPDYADACYNMGNALQYQGKLDQAIEAYNEALSIKPDYADCYSNIGATLKEQGKLEEALGAYNKALSIKPDHCEAYYNMGVTLQDLGKLEKAIKAYTKAYSIKPDYAKAHRNISVIKQYSKDDDQIAQVQELHRQENLSDEARCSFSFTLAKMYEDIGKLDLAFKYLSEGNALRKKLLNYSIKQDHELFTKLKNAQPHLLKNSVEIIGKSVEAKPIFILGMPRSGTTLVEQIISSHSEVFGGGELEYVAQFGKDLVLDTKLITTTAISEFRESYLSELSKLLNGKKFITDKMPQNFRFVPLICAAFPEAKIIHVQRHASAICWSNYKQYFASNSLGYCYDLKDVVEYYRLYKELMHLWHSQYGDRIYNLNYEKLTTDQENQTRKLINYLGLNWEEACLSPQKNKRIVRTASQRQVRQKVYKGSSKAWRKYEPFLNGAFDSLKST